MLLCLEQSFGEEIYHQNDMSNVRWFIQQVRCYTSAAPSDEVFWVIENTSDFRTESRCHKTRDVRTYAIFLCDHKDLSHRHGSDKNLMTKLPLK